MTSDQVFLVALSALLSNPTEETARLLRAAAERDAPARPAMEVGGRHQRRLSTSELSALIESYQSGATTDELASLFGIGHGTVSRHLAREGVVTRLRSLTEEQVGTAERLYESGLSLERVGQRFGVSAGTICHAFAARGIPRRDRRGGRRSNKAAADRL